MYGGFNIWLFLMGLPLGLLIVGTVLFISRKNGKKQRRFDERYTAIHRQARSYSWFATTAAILICWMTSLIIEGPSIAFFMLTAIWIVHMASYAIGAASASSKN